MSERAYRDACRRGVFYDYMRDPDFLAGHYSAGTGDFRYRAPLGRQVLHVAIGGHMPLVDVALMLHAIADRIGLTSSRCPYCGASIFCRWPWQGRSSHECAG